MSLVPRATARASRLPVAQNLPMSERFVPRAEFAFPSRTGAWFPGSMAKGLRLIQDRLPFIDVLIEVRDARMPLSSINPMLEGFTTDNASPLSQKPRLIVYAKRDLAEKRLEKPIREAMQRYGGHKVMFCDTSSPHDCRKIVEQASRMVATKDLPIHFEKDIRYIDGEPHLLQPSLEKQDARQRAIRLMCIGMPDMGKSSLVNGFRKTFMNQGGAMTVSPVAGETKGVTAVKVRNNPPTYVWDAPGLFMPWIGNEIEQALKVALAGSVKQGTVDPEYIAEYLMYRLNWRHFHPEHSTPFEKLPEPLQRLVTRGIAPTNHFAKFVEGISQAGNADAQRHEACMRIMRWFQRGKLGLWQLDDLGTASDSNGNPPPGCTVKLESDGTRMSNMAAVDAAVSNAFHAAVRQSLRPHLETISASQAKTLMHRQHRRLLGVPETPRFSEGKERLRRLEKKRQMQWELALGPSRKSENRLNMAQPRAKLLPSWMPRMKPRRYRRIAQDLRRQAAESIGTEKEKRVEDLTMADVDWSRMPLSTIYTMPDKYRDKAIQAKADSPLLLAPPDSGSRADQTAIEAVYRQNVEREAAKEFIRRRNEPGTFLPMVPDLPAPGTIVTVVPHLQAALRPVDRPGLTQYAYLGKPRLDPGLRLVARTRSQRRKKQHARVRAGVDQERSKRSYWRSVQARRRVSGSKRARRNWKSFYNVINMRRAMGRRRPGPT